MKILNGLTLILFIFSCTHSKKKAFFTEKIEAGQCLEAYQNIPESKRMKVISAIKEVSGRTASYLVTGLGYTSDTVLVSGVVVTGGVVCYPLFKKYRDNQKAGKGHKNWDSVSGGAMGDLLSYCVLLAPTASYLGAKKTLKKLYSGKKAYNKTARWRCPRVNPISRAIREVAICFQRQGDLEKAKWHLHSLQKDTLFSQCLSSEEKNNVKEALAKLEKS